MGNELEARARACVKKPKKAPHVAAYPAQALSVGGDATRHPYAYYLLSYGSEEFWLHVGGRGFWPPSQPLGSEASGSQSSLKTDPPPVHYLFPQVSLIYGW